MQLLNPIWLTALAALGIPVLIHLWNIRPGKTLKVGSISIFEEASPASSRSFKLLDILLLILRCLLLAIVALLLSTPIWQQKPGQSAKGWILIPHRYLSEAYHQYKTKIDSLSNNGYEFHYFDAGFPKGKMDKILKDSVASKNTNDSTNYWLLAAQLDKQIPATTPVEVFTPNANAHFQGNQLGTTHHFTWNTFTPADSVKTWLATAWVTDNGSIRLAQGTGKPSGIVYQYTDIRNGDNNPLYEIKTADGHTSISLKSGDSTQTIVTNHPTELAIYTANNEADADYLRAALDAAGRFMLQRVQVKIYHQPSAIPTGVEWLFWLSDAPVSAKNAHHVLYYTKGKSAANNSWLVNKGSHEHPQLFRSIITQKTDEQPLWADGSGHVILGEKQPGQSTLYPFYSRFNPTWNDLVWNDAFPNWLLQLLSPEAIVAAKNDVRVLDKQQLQPHLNTASQASFQVKPDSASLSYELWILLALIFFAERWLAHKNNIKLKNG